MKIMFVFYLNYDCLLNQVLCVLVYYSYLNCLSSMLMFYCRTSITSFSTGSLHITQKQYFYFVFDLSTGKSFTFNTVITNNYNNIFSRNFQFSLPLTVYDLIHMCGMKRLLFSPFIRFNRTFTII